MSEVLALTGWLDVPVRRLSLGTRQKVGLVGALAHEPDVVILDEPTNGLDPLAVVGFRDLLREVTGRGGAVLVTGHHFDELTRLADRVDILHRGRIIDTIVPEEPGCPGGADLERVFFDAVLAAGGPPGGDTILLPRAHDPAEHHGGRAPARRRSRARREAHSPDE